MAGHPIGKFPTVDPDMLASVFDVWGTHFQPISQGTVGDMQILGKFGHFIKHGQESRGLDDHTVGELDAMMGCIHIWFAFM
jgi:hypothetical protein